ncbi:MAG: hypothetical protein MUC62_08210 [Candidatus Thermoplasmatota archaeon]|nr:hypothetical protein [Candidatus Thermoplasmatota archaeon]
MKIETTVYGVALNISSSNHLKLKAHFEFEMEWNNWTYSDYIFYDLTMRDRNGTTSWNPYWVFLNSSSNNSIKINYQAYWQSTPFKDDGRSSWSLDNEEMKLGWQKVYFEE